MIWDRYEVNQTYYSAMHTGWNAVLMKETSTETFPREEENSCVAQQVPQESVRLVFEIHQGF